MSEFAVDYNDENLGKIRDLYSKNGFVLIDNVFPENETDEMKLEMAKIVEGLNLDNHPKSVFSTEDADKVSVLKTVH